ncbi:hypothetical protein [Streptomyces sp. NEAU-W12]|uniref:hypothetical protein n=1 Tax=Streptomyces sp. NEAU-W12 TaxID=2994668 RepID=UPI00224B7728|nr:hypothetical protein [Streptomyces sp. NEAU-W12]MCX2922308.1 hypothetical protein [Streptomyces sp. NEAU-W12]
MASIRTARVIAAVSALPLAVALFTGVAAADSGALAEDGSSATAASAASGVDGDNFGTSATSQQQAVGSGASNQSDTAQVNGSAFTAVSQGNDNVAISFTPLW